MSETVHISVPATTANLGPGFDCLGLALRLYNHVTVRSAAEPMVGISGHGRDELPRDTTNLMVRSATELARRAGYQLPALAWSAHHDVPLARGLGSSSAAIVAGLLAADAVLHLALPRTRLVEIAAEIEGHPDNVAPALLGGLTVCLSGTSSLKVARLDPHPELRIVLLIPQFPITTESARQVLPACVAYEDAVFNLSRSAATVAALHEGLWPLLGEATRDRLHQPYRLPLMPGVDKVMEAAAEAGAYGVALSGSGPTVAAFCTAGTGRIARAMLRAAKTAGMSATAVVTIPDLHGATVSRDDQ